MLLYTTPLLLTDPAMVATQSDFMATHSTVTFPAGTTKACSMVVAMDDNIVEMDEDFNVCLTYSGNQQGVSLGNTSVTTVTIINDDGGSDHFVQYSGCCLQVTWLRGLV